MIYKTNEVPPIDSIVELYRSVNWGHQYFPASFETAYKNSTMVVSSYTDSGELVGLGRAISDGAFTVYFPDLLVKPNWQGKGIGTEIMARMLDNFKGFHNQVLVAEDEKARQFYIKCGFEGEKSALSIQVPFNKVVASTD